jgi:hypothetical protein
MQKVFPTILFRGAQVQDPKLKSVLTRWLKNPGGAEDLGKFDSL